MRSARSWSSTQTQVPHTSSAPLDIRPAYPNPPDKYTCQRSQTRPLVSHPATTHTTSGFPYLNKYYPDTPLWTNRWSRESKSQAPSGWTQSNRFRTRCSGSSTSRSRQRQEQTCSRREVGSPRLCRNQCPLCRPRSAVCMMSIAAVLQIQRRSMTSPRLPERRLKIPQRRTPPTWTLNSSNWAWRRVFPFCAWRSDSSSSSAALRSPTNSALCCPSTFQSGTPSHPVLTPFTSAP